MLIQRELSAIVALESHTLVEIDRSSVRGVCEATP
jgi:hypothetical protein